MSIGENNTTQHYKRCDNCKGAGRLILQGSDYGVCPVCRGRGVVKKYEKVGD